MPVEDSRPVTLGVAIVPVAFEPCIGGVTEPNVNCVCSIEKWKKIVKTLSTCILKHIIF